VINEAVLKLKVALRPSNAMAREDLIKEVIELLSSSPAADESTTPSQAKLDARVELEVKASLWDEVRIICVPHGAGVDKPITEWLAERLAAPSQPAAPAVDMPTIVANPGERVTMTFEQYRALMKRPATEAHAAAVPTEDARGGLMLTAAQLLAALDFIAPDRDTDRDQLECEVTIQYGAGHSGDGLYCWCTEEPDEGAILLDGAVGEPVAALASQAAPNAASDTPGPARATIGHHDLSTTAGGRGYIAEFFAKRLHRHDFGRYVAERLAADFACVLAQYLSEHDAGPSQPAAPATDDLASMTRMFHAACSALGLINEALGLDPDDGGAEPIIEAINELKVRAPATAAHAGAMLTDEQRDSAGVKWSNSFVNVFNEPVVLSESRQYDFRQGFDAARALLAAAPTPAQNEKPDDADFFAGVCVALQVVTAHDSGVEWAEIVQACGIDELLQYAAHVEPDEWKLAGFAKYTRGELGKRKPAKRAVSAPTPDAEKGESA
jgi:hypothetical protein